MRTVHIDDQEFQYKVGRQRVRITFPNGKSISPDFSELTGWSWDRIERAMWKRYFRIVPSDVKRFIEDTMAK